VPFGWQTTKALVEEMLTNVEVMGRSVELRRNGPDPFRTDEGNLILDLRLRRISNPGS
jgi:ribose 5-phosphate isomerase A